MGNNDNNPDIYTLITQNLKFKSQKLTYNLKLNLTWLKFLVFS